MSNWMQEIEDEIDRAERLNKIFKYAEGQGREGDLRTSVVCLANAMCDLIDYLKEIEYGRNHQGIRSED